MLRKKATVVAVNVAAAAIDTDTEKAKREDLFKPDRVAPFATPAKTQTSTTVVTLFLSNHRPIPQTKKRC